MPTHEPSTGRDAYSHTGVSYCVHVIKIRLRDAVASQGTPGPGLAPEEYARRLAALHQESAASHAELPARTKVPRGQDSHSAGRRCRGSLG